MKGLKILLIALMFGTLSTTVFADVLQTQTAEYAKTYSDENWAALKRYAVSNDDPAVGRVLDIGSRLAKLTGKHWDVCVFDDPKAPLAFELPGYRIAISRKLVNAYSDDALAWTVAHEMGHGLMQHTEQLMTSVLAEDAEVHLLAGGYESPLPWKQLFIKYQPDVDSLLRRQEVMADAIGVKLSTAAGFNGKAGAEEVLSSLPRDPSDTGHPEPAVRLGLIEQQQQ